MPVVQPIRPDQKDALDYERDRIESRDMQERNYTYQQPEPAKFEKEPVSFILLIF